MGFAAIARVTEDKWVACSVHDEIKFGLVPGGELRLDTTICNEIRQSGDPVIIDHVENDATYSKHHTPAMYGFQSYISVPINMQDGRFFGTLCAIDPKPSMLNTPEIIGMFKLYATLISLHLKATNVLSADEITAIERDIANELKDQLDTLSGLNTRSQDGIITDAIYRVAPIQLNKRSETFIEIINSSSRRIRQLVTKLQDRIS